MHLVGNPMPQRVHTPLRIVHAVNSFVRVVVVLGSAWGRAVRS